MGDTEMRTACLPQSAHSNGDRVGARYALCFDPLLFLRLQRIAVAAAPHPLLGLLGIRPRSKKRADAQRKDLETKVAQRKGRKETDFDGLQHQNMTASLYIIF